MVLKVAHAVGDVAARVFLVAGVAAAKDALRNYKDSFLREEGAVKIPAVPETMQDGAGTA